MSADAVAFLLGELAGVVPEGTKWDSMKSIMNNPHDKKMKAAFIKVDRLIREKHFDIMGNQYPDYKSKPNQYPARRTGDLQGSLLTTLELPKKGKRHLRLEYMADHATHRGYFYPKKLFAESGKPGSGRKSVEHLMYEMIDEIHDILQVPFNITPLEAAF